MDSSTTLPSIPYSFNSDVKRTLQHQLLAISTDKISITNANSNLKYVQSKYERELLRMKQDIEHAEEKLKAEQNKLRDHETTYLELYAKAEREEKEERKKRKLEYTCRDRDHMMRRAYLRYYFIQPEVPDDLPANTWETIFKQLGYDDSDYEETTRLVYRRDLKTGEKKPKGLELHPWFKHSSISECGDYPGCCIWRDYYFELDDELPELEYWYKVSDGKIVKPYIYVCEDCGETFDKFTDDNQVDEVEAGNWLVKHISEC